MKIAARTHRHAQTRFLPRDVELTSEAQGRTFIGDFCEQATAIHFEGERITIDSTAVCPDLYVPRTDEYLEVKSVGSTKRGILYHDRIRKYDSFMELGHRLRYVFWFHSWRWSDHAPNTLEELRHTLSGCLHTVLSVPAQRVHDWAHEQTPRKMNWRSERHPKPGEETKRIPMMGYSIPWSLFNKWIDEARSCLVDPFEVYRQTILFCQQHIVGG